MKNYASYSFWLETCGDDLTPRPGLDGSADVDVAILGAGFTGLWTAWYLKQADPSLSVAVIEAEIAGFGASGRNGGWCYSGFPKSPLELLGAFGYDTARAVTLAMYDSVDMVGEVCRQEGIDCHFHKGGELQVARAERDLPKLQETYDQYRAIGLADHYELLDKTATDARIKVAGAVGGYRNKESAVIQPARLARGLAHAVERKGVTIYEQTRVNDFTPGARPVLHTERGDVRARVIVLAGEAYLSQLEKTKRDIIPATSHIVVTEPLTDAQWDQIGWENREVLMGFGTTNGYIQRTADGRIAFGPFRGVYPYNSKITDDLDRDESVFEQARQSTLVWWPMLKGIRFTHSWGGVFGMPRDHMPTMSYDPKTGVATGQGYSGEGVATANLSGRVLADLITGKDTDLTRLPMTSHSIRPWEPEPVRWMGVQAVRKSMRRTTAQIEKNDKYPDKPTLAERLWNW